MFDMATLKELRQNANLSQKELAIKIGVSTQHVSCWERGVYTPNTSSVRKICRALRCKQYELQFNKDDSPYVICGNPALDDISMESTIAYGVRRIKDLEKQVTDGTTLLEKIVLHMDIQEEYIENLENIIKDADLGDRLPP